MTEHEQWIQEYGAWETMMRTDLAIAIISISCNDNQEMLRLCSSCDLPFFGEVFSTAEIPESVFCSIDCRDSAQFCAEQRRHVAEKGRH